MFLFQVAIPFTKIITIITKIIKNIMGNNISIISNINILLSVYFSTKYIYSFNIIAEVIRFFNYRQLRLYSRLNDFLNTCRKRKTAIKQTAVLLRLVLYYEYTISFNTISSTQARMLFINPIHLIISVAFSSSVTPCFRAISFIKYSAVLQAEVSISARCSYNFPLVSRL